MYRSGTIYLVIIVGAFLFLIRNARRKIALFRSFTHVNDLHYRGSITVSGHVRRADSPCGLGSVAFIYS